MKAVENRLMLLFGNTDAGVGYAKAGGVAGVAGLDRDTSPHGSELYCVTQQVVKHLHESQAVGVEDEVLGNRVVDVHALGRGYGPHVSEDLCRRVRDAEILVFQLQMTG